MNGITKGLPEGGKQDITAKLITRFKELITDGVLVPGCKLPAERDLSLRLGVSRPSLRQALKVLEIMGVLRQRVGDGTYLREDASTVLNEPMDFLVLLGSLSHDELFEARLIVEPELAARAAERATSGDLARLRQALATMKRNTSRPDRLAEADLAFHDAIFQAAGNRVCRLMFQEIQRMLLGSISTTSRFVTVRHTLDFHGAIYSAIHDRNAEAARQRMIEHLVDARRVLTRSNLRPEASVDLITSIHES